MGGTIYIILIALVVLLFLGYKVYSIEKLKRDPVVISMMNKIEPFLSEIDMYKKDYFTKPLEEKIVSDYNEIYEFFTKKPYSKLKIKRIINFKGIYSDLTSHVKEWNEQYIERELANNKTLFDNIDGKSLDDQQRKAVIVDEVNNLVLAGAGSGKTLTISGKVKYLVDVKNVKPNEILLISFTTKAAEEMYQRISKKLHIDVEAKTFHKLGLGIITKTKGRRFDVAEDYFLPNLINSYFDSNFNNNKKQIENIITFFGYYLNIPKDWQDFDSLGECYDYYRNIDFETIKGKIQNTEKDINEIAKSLKASKQTLKGETVKSLEEVIIANFLFLNGINYLYEYEYPYKSADKYKKTYRPDFYLPDYDIYIEHFGVTKENRTPSLSRIEEIKYLDDMKWKIQFHKDNSTNLIESYSYFNKEGRLLVELEKKLRASKVDFKEVDYIKVYEQIYDNKSNKYFTEFKKLIASFINLFKSNGYTIEMFDNLIQKAKGFDNIFLRERTLIFLDIVKPIFVNYQEGLQKSGQIDFNDMINLATETVREGKGEFDYKYIIIDEYQDISLSRFNLVNEIKKRTNAKLICVGDDWQSIYRFAGSDINLFTDFKRHVGYYELLKIEKTYRNSQELINIAGKFVMRNSKQLKKDLKSDKHHSNPLRIIGYDNDIYTAIKKVINEIVYSFGPEAEITILGRNNFDIDFIEEKGEFILNKSTSKVTIKYAEYPNLKVNFLTAHRSKGLEADNVIVINLENKLVGFPNKISDDPVLSLVLTGLDEFNYAEERRLFYVALTRTKNTTYLIVPDKKQSVFVQELINDFHIKYEFATKEETLKNNPNCPKCKKGHLVIRENSNDKKKFLGCTNFPLCDLALNDIRIIKDQIICRDCGGYMTKRDGPYGEFYGCTNFPNCEGTIKVGRY